MTIEELILKLNSASLRSDTDLVRKAFAFAQKAHEGQFRDSGDEYIQHPLAVAGILAELELDTVTVAAGLLHDVVEDTETTISDIERVFGSEMAVLVDGVTKLGKLEYRSREEEQAENLRKMFLAMAKDIRVIIIKLADRLHNMRTLEHLNHSRRMDIANETLDIYAPLAHRLGMWRFKWELEDLAFRYKDPEAYEDLVQKVAKQRREREEYITKVMSILNERLKAAGIEADISGRAKHFYSIHRKMTLQGKTFEEIYDLLAIRVIVDTIKDCYAALGIAHSLWKPMPGRFKDYIAMPKSNMYQSLHTTVMGPDGEPFEIQIRTWEMHRTAEFGIAAHWKYKEGAKDDKDFEDKIAWLRQVLEWQRDLRDAREFMESLKIDLFDDEVFVFTPQGDVIDLPAGSTPVDFAYRIHTEVGHRCVGAKINGRIMPLDYVLQNGEIVEILTSKQSPGPSADWLKFVKTSQARSKIRQWFKKERREENIVRGRELLEREFKRMGLEALALTKDEYMSTVAMRLNFISPEDLLSAIGYGGVSAQHVAGKLRDEWQKSLPPGVVSTAEKKFSPSAVPKKSGLGVSVKGASNLLVKFAKCCNPVPGDPIIGYITRGRGISVHRLTCPNMTNMLADRERFIEVAWDLSVQAHYPVEVEVKAYDRPGLLSDITGVISDTGVNIASAVVRTNPKKGFASMNLVLEITDLKELDAIAQLVRKIKGVTEFHRAEKEGRSAG
ncbi:MAG TPA: bifunctional (p)ppGpp synthetase/guanosine-3',5'-bis(diphosphate) 3'-pyrophosphohydrolase [Clostridia bacterium]|nr:bifunctional (p)ppGpp synthetase/guanosine-3',5'-bis(diphosphate) 3'-pyrophosphohydrolase [Clostridia bacterium]